MEDIRREDRKLFIKELFAASRLSLVFVGCLMGYAFLKSVEPGPLFVIVAASVGAAVYGFSAWNASEKKRFRSRRMEALWAGCQDRLARFEEVLRRMRKEQVAELNEMPRTIREISKSMYAALRRADWIADEVAASEKDLISSTPVWQASARDAQSKELYRIADKNIAEYRAHYGGVIAGVQRTEAQAAVYMTTLDSLRMKMIGYRLVGKAPEMSSTDFLESIAEARMQLQAIDHALEELDLGHYPKTIAVVPGRGGADASGLTGTPPPIPGEVSEEIRIRLSQGEPEDVR